MFEAISIRNYDGDLNDDESHSFESISRENVNHREHDRSSSSSDEDLRTTSHRTKTENDRLENAFRRSKRNETPEEGNYPMTSTTMGR